MKFSKVVFVNYFHNGDIHLSRQMVKRIVDKFPQYKYSYAHKCSSRLVHDIMPHVSIESVPKSKGGFGSTILNDTLYLNTWYGSYNHKFHTAGIVFDALYDVFNHNLKTHFNTSWEQLEPDPSKLFPTIDFSKYNIANIDKFINNNKGKYDKMILISNGHAQSGQAANFNFGPVISAVAKKYPKYLFIHTNKDSHINHANNIKYSVDIIGEMQNDLNENAYISTFCDMIVGRSSGAYTFSMIQKNMFDRKTMMVSFSNLGTNDNKYWLGPKMRNKITYSSQVLNYNRLTSQECEKSFLILLNKIK